MIIIYGKSGSGKDLFAQELVKNLPGYRIGKRPTSKPQRSSGDISYYDYYSKDGMIHPDIAYLTEFRNWLYGIYKKDLTDDKVILTLDGKTAQKVKKEYPSTILIEIKADKEVRINRCLKREIKPDVDEIFRRMDADEIDYKKLNIQPDYVVENNIDNVFKKELKNEARRIGGLILNEKK